MIFFVGISAVALAGCGTSSDDASSGSSNNNNEGNSDRTENSENSNDSNYPEDSIQVIIPYKAGGGSDMVARTLGKHAKGEFGESFEYVYREGGGGAIGASEVAKADNDGYTIGTVNFPHIVLQSIEESGDFDPLEDFDYIATVATTSGILTTPGKSEYADLESFIEGAKDSPGELTLGIAGKLSDAHISALMLQEEAGINITIVPFSGGTDLLSALLGNQVDAGFCTAELCKPEEERLNFIAVTSGDRSDQVPDVPTFTEEGYDVIGFVGRLFVAPSGLEAETLSTLREGFENIFHLDEFQEGMTDANFYPDWMSGEEVYDLIENYYPKAEMLLDKYEGG